MKKFIYLRKQLLEEVAENPYKKRVGEIIKNV